MPHFTDLILHYDGQILGEPNLNHRGQGGGLPCVCACVCVCVEGEQDRSVCIGAR